MRVRAFSAVVAFAFVAAAAGCSPSGGGSDERVIPESALPVLVLQPDDLPDVFTRFDEGALAIADAPLGERADPERFGRVGGWKARYRRFGSAATRGPLVVESRIDLFEGSGGAEQEFDAHSDELEVQQRHPSVARLLEVDRLGEEAVVLVPGPSDIKDSVVFFTVVWRDRNVTGAIVANGFDQKLVLGDVLELARAQERHIAAAPAPS